jgi:proline iminopeptidase
VTVEQCADDVVAFCEALSIEKPIVLGFSFGGMVAMSYAARYSDHPGKLILLSTSAHRDLDRILGVFERLGGSRAVDIAREFLQDPCERTLAPYLGICLPLYYRTPQDPEAEKRVLVNLPMALRFFAEQYPRMDLRPLVPRILCPTLVLAGSDDPITPLEDAGEIAAAMTSGAVALRRFPQCGHGVFPDDPSGTIAAVRHFLTPVQQR